MENKFDEIKTVDPNDTDFIQELLKLPDEVLRKSVELLQKEMKRRNIEKVKALHEMTGKEKQIVLDWGESFGAREYQERTGVDSKLARGKMRMFMEEYYGTQ